MHLAAKIVVSGCQIYGGGRGDTDSSMGIFTSLIVTCDRSLEMDNFDGFRLTSVRLAGNTRSQNIIRIQRPENLYDFHAKSMFDINIVSMSV